MAALLLPLNGVMLSVPPTQPLDDLLRVLGADGGAPMRAWLAAAHHLLAAGREADFEALLGKAVDRESRNDDVFTRIQAMCTLAEYTAQRAAAERDRRQRQMLLLRCTDLCHRAQRLDLEEQLPELVLGNIALVKVWAGPAPAAASLAVFAGCPSDQLALA